MINIGIEKVRIIEIFTDGSCDNIAGRALSHIGGIGIVIDDDGDLIEVSEGPFESTTSARMEIQAIIRAIELVGAKDSMLHIHSDNQYCVNALEKDWIFNWEQQGWAKKNSDLWQKFLKLYREINGQVKLFWVRGHSGNLRNEIADDLANKGRGKALACRPVR